MAIFVTGATGYIGAHVIANLLEESGEPLKLLVRAKSEQEARRRLWRALQLHMDFPRFHSCLDSRMQIFRGDLTGARFGLPDD
ncbi:MAG: SDR family oxidoreductase, partial [Candidatus Acidiferrales bacterium]